MTGPGVVWLQTLPLPNLAHALSPFMEREGDKSSPNSPGSLIGGLLGN
jgi:hypothetical protein